MPQTIGYARVSTTEQNLDLQMDALERAGCLKVFKDQISGSKGERPGLREALDYLREGDTLVVWKLDRLGRSLRHLIDTVTSLDERGIGFKSLQENLDTTTSGGRLVFHIFGALAEFERELIRERTHAGLKSARARGRLGGRPAKLGSKELSFAKRMLQDETVTVKEVAKTLGVSRATLYRYLSLEAAGGSGNGSGSNGSNGSNRQLNDSQTQESNETQNQNPSSQDPSKQNSETKKRRRRRGS